jgi:hypothetical protein
MDPSLDANGTRTPGQRADHGPFGGWIIAVYTHIGKGSLADPVECVARPLDLYAMCFDPDRQGKHRLQQGAAEWSEGVIDI